MLLLLLPSASPETNILEKNEVKTRNERSHPTVGGAPEFPEPVTLGAQYPTRYDTWKNFVRDTRPALVCASAKTNIRVTVFVLTGSFSLEELNWSEILGPKSATPLVG